MHEISTKLEILDDEYQTRYSHNPIHHMERRMKSIRSIAGKLLTHRKSLTIENIENNVFDIAGIRVMCNYVDDVYAIASMLSRQSDIRILEVKDYIKHPKASGYRSLHVIYSVPACVIRARTIQSVWLVTRRLCRTLLRNCLVSIWLCKTFIEIWYLLRAKLILMTNNR